MLSGIAVTENGQPSDANINNDDDDDANDVVKIHTKSYCAFYHALSHQHVLHSPNRDLALGRSARAKRLVKEGER